MCLGIPGVIVEMSDDSDLATADVFGARRQINLGLLTEPIAAGEWVLLHVGFAVSKLDDEEVELAKQSLAMVGNDPGTDEMFATDPAMDPGFIQQWETEEAV